MTSPRAIINVSGLVPEAQEITRCVAEIYLSHTRSWLISLLARGSAVTGGCIPGCSDINLLLYLDEGTFVGGLHPPLDLSLSVQSDLATISCAPFRRVQCEVVSPNRLDTLTGPIPGAYHVIAGHCHLPETTPKQLETSAQAALDALQPWPPYVTSALWSRGAGRLPYCIRRLCTDVWAVLRQVLTFELADPLRAWQLPKVQAMALLAPESARSRLIWDFYRALQVYYPEQTDIEAAWDIVEHGIAFRRAARAWWQERG